MSFSDEEVAAFLKNPVVYDVSRDQITLTLEFKRAIYDKWVKEPNEGTVKWMLQKNGIDTGRLPKMFFRNIAYTFKRKGKPTREAKLRNSLKNAVLPGKDDTVEFRPDQLIATGKFIRGDHDIEFAPDSIQELFRSYPDVPVMGSIRASGIDPDMIGIKTIDRLEKRFRAAIEAGTAPGRSRNGMTKIPPEQQAELRRNPYVELVKDRMVRLHKRFYGSAAVLEGQLSVDRILHIYLIDCRTMTIREKKEIRERLRKERPVPGGIQDPGTVFEADVLRRREKALKEIVDAGFETLAAGYRSLRGIQKKEVCIWIAGLPKDPRMEYTRSFIVGKIGISRSVYYRYVHQEDYGISRYKADREAAAAIREVFFYKGFRKGVRQVYMLLPRLTGMNVGQNRVRRLMKEEGLSSGVRRSTGARKRAAVLEEEKVKPDLLRRRFRLYRPNQVRVTDVTVLWYGETGTGSERRKAYGSALMDPVTGRLLAFVVSGTNDLEMALETLRAADRYPCEDGGIFHSDRGVLYKAKQFQKEILDRGLSQSMSKKGNCWDNAVQESFFGHFKDECDYAGCMTLAELQKKIAEYMDYYNNERGIWDRGRMTPVEYEGYLLSLHEEEFGRYLAEEEKKYEAMKKRAAELAKKRYGTPGE